MKACRSFILFMVVLFGLNPSARAVEPADFRYTAQIESRIAQDVPNCLPLQREIISETRNGFSDLRIFDDLGRETPYVIYGESKPQQNIKTFTFKVLSYNETDNLIEIVLERPKKGAAYSSIQFITSNRDFKKSVRIMAGSNREVWNELASDILFDFSSRINLRKTSIEIPETDLPYLKVLIQNDSLSRSDGTDIKLQYDGLEFTVDRSRTKIFRIDRINGSKGISTPAEEVHDYAFFKDTDTSIDSDGNTVINLGLVNLPVTEVTLKVDNPYYHRLVELWSSDSVREDSFHKSGKGTIYKVPGMNKSKSTIRFQQPKRKYLQLKILNGDNPQLRIREIKIAWVRQNLYFIPEDGRSYALHYSAAKINTPRYELKSLIVPEYEKLKDYKVISIKSIQSNPYYRPQKQTVKTKEKLEKFLFTGVVLILVCGLGFWVYRLMKKIPTDSGE